MRGILRRLIGERRAVAAVEFAIIAPVMVVLAGGIVEIGALVRTYTTVNRLTMQYALSLADCADTTVGVCQTEMNNDAATTTLANIVPQLTVSKLTLSMAQVQMSGTTPTVEYTYPTGATLTAAQTSALQAAVTSGNYGVVVTASYTYSLLFFSKLMAPIIGSSFPISFSVAQLKN